ncbi:hypothetical protein [Streptomyces sp. Midd1]|uniref:hypothetical protein n=1 Tax=Streptomyces sp. Midd3 TaxID=3161191 RepID=UPI0034DB12AF
MWQVLGAYQRMSLEEATAEAIAFSQNLYAWPLGLRVVGPGDWASERIGGREEITLTVNPITGVWTVGCTKCSHSEESEDRYNGSRFARHHQC